jgi:hypothetical protein
MNDEDKITTTNSHGDIVPGSQVMYHGTLCNVGEVHRNTLEIISKNFMLTVGKDEVEKV